MRYEVLGLIIGDAPYEEYVLSTEELHLLKKSDPLVCELTGKCCVTSISVDK